MARIIMTILIPSAAVLFLAPSSFAFWCKGRIISTGDFIDSVIAKCGEPTSSRVVKEELGGVIREGTVTTTVEQTDVLMYNCGDGRLIHLLTFRGGKLEKIETAGYGSGPRRCD